VADTETSHDGIGRAYASHRAAKILKHSDLTKPHQFCLMVKMVM